MLVLKQQSGDQSPAGRRRKRRNEYIMWLSKKKETELAVKMMPHILHRIYIASLMGLEFQDSHKHWQASVSCLFWRLTDKKDLTCKCSNVIKLNDSCFKCITSDVIDYLAAGYLLISAAAGYWSILFLIKIHFQQLWKLHPKSLYLYLYLQRAKQL